MIRLGLETGEFSYARKTFPAVRFTRVSNLPICTECSVGFHGIVGILAELTVVLISKFCFPLEVTIMGMNSLALNALLTLKKNLI